MKGRRRIAWAGWLVATAALLTGPTGDADVQLADCKHGRPQFLGPLQ